MFYCIALGLFLCSKINHVSSNDLNVDGCVFEGLSNSAGGGAIYVKSDCLLGVKLCTFSMCSAQNNGGSIYCESKICDFYSICVFKCTVVGNYWGQFAKMTNTDRCNMRYLSLCKCPHNSVGYYPISTGFGSQVLQNSNCSQASVVWGESIWFREPSTLVCSYNSFVDNKASDCICLYVSAGSGLRSMSHSNFVNNIQLSSSYSLIVTQYKGSLDIMEAIFINNSRTLFYTDGESSIRAINCVVVHLYSLLSGTVTIENPQYSNTATYGLNHFRSFYCHADLLEPTSKIRIIMPSKIMVYCFIFINIVGSLYQ